MSELIKVNHCDVEDAHSKMDQVELYNKIIIEKRKEQDPKTGKLLRPYTFSVVQGFFEQSAPETDDSVFDFVTENFGLAKPSWEQLVEDLHKLNEESPDNESYKLVFCARHGQGVHNRAVEFFGLDAWNNKWSLVEGTTLEDGTTMTWGPDPFLTERGEAQADLLNKAWKKQIQENGAPIPDKFFSSPFTRSCSTLIRTWSGIAVCKDGEDESKLLGKERKYPYITENLRETIGEHLCDKRSPKRIIIERNSPYGFKIEDSFEEEDVYYKDDWRETLPEQSLRADAFFQELFSDYPEDEIVYTASHAGEIRSIITALGHRPFTIPTAGMIPIVIKAVKN